MDIIKASGEREKFSRKKLYESLKRAGTQFKLAERVSKEIARKVHSGITTEKILDRVTHCLRRENPILAARYNLKRAIFKLGPTGFPFERYVAAILKEYGYATRVGKIVKGHCVNHEIDVIAKKNKKQLMIECKYHNIRGIRSDVKVALYTFARFLDIKRSFYQVWLVTNTRCTSEATRYARCVGLKIISWRYPKNKSLEYLIEKKGLYPITILPSLTKYARERLAQQRIVLAKDLLKYSLGDLIRRVGLQPKIAKKLQEEIKQLCLY